MGGPGRRSVDNRRGPPAWLRILVLSVALAVGSYVLLFARDVARPIRDSEALLDRTLMREAELTAAVLEARRTQAEAALGLAAEALARRPGQALDALEAGRRAHPALSLAAFDGEGRALAAAGADAAAFQGGSPGAVRASADGRALLLSRSAGDRSIVARLEVGDGSRVVAGSGSARLRTSSGEAGGRRRALAPIGETGLAVAAERPFDAPTATMLDDAWVLAVPVLIGLTVMLLLLIQARADARRRRAWAETERRFGVAVEGARCGVWEWDLEAEEVTLSDFMAELLGLPQGGVTPAEAVLGRVHPKYREALIHALRQAAAFGDFEAAFPVPDGKGGPRWIDARGQAHGAKGPEGYAVVLGVALDVTEARRAKAQAQAAEGRLRDAIESVTDAFVLFDRADRLVLWNKGFEDAFAFPDGVVRKGALKQELNRIAALAIKAEHPATGGRAGAREVELHDGRWLQLSERYTSDHGTVVTAADVTAIKRQEAERRQAAESLQLMVTQLERSQEKLATLARKYEVAMTRAEAANQAKSEFLANMSHELRTPLNAINGFSEIMAGEMFGPLGDQRYKGYAADILKSGQHLLSLINDILDMAKIEAGKMSLHYDRVSVKEVCEDAIRLMRGKVAEAGLTLTLDAPELPEIDADQRGLKQVMLNLISNAVKFTPEGGSIVVALSRPEDDLLRVAVTDDGIGISPEDLERLAKPFEQVEGQHSKTTQGTGLGLALTKSLIELHGGEWRMESEPGRGTTVSFTLPLKRPPAEAEERRAA